MYTASTTRRLIAYLIDHFIIFIFYSPVWIQGLGSFFKNRTVQIDWVWFVFCFVLQFLFRWIFLKFLGGGPGKFFLGLRVVDVNSSENVGWFQGLVRILGEHLSFFFGTSLYVLALMRFDRRHVVDWIAETQVRQVLPRVSPPRPRYFLTIALFLYFLISNFGSIYHLVQRTELESGQIIFHPIIDDSDSLESGS